MSEAQSKAQKLVFFLIAVVILTASCTKKDSSQQPSLSTSSAKDSLSERGVSLAAGLLADDLKASLGGDSSAISKDEALAVAHIGIAVEARKYEADYNSNEIAADNKYRGKKILLTGTVKAINKNALGQGYFELRGGNPYIGVEAVLTDQVSGWAQQVHKGEIAYMVCDPSVRVVTVATLANCVSLYQHIDELTPALKDDVRTILSGKRPVPRHVAQVIAASYAAATLLPPDSPCFSDLQASPCTSSLATVKNAEMKEKVAQIMPLIQIN
jgi:hypothetical protein